MRHLFILILSCSFFTILSCDDGDIITVELDFDDTFESCEESDLLFFKTKEDPLESLSLLFTSLDYEDLFEISEDSIQYNGGTTSMDMVADFNYRTYNRADRPDNLFCSLIPPRDLNVVIDEDSRVNVGITRTLTEDDNDGIPSALEGPRDPLGDDDGDEVFNFLDDAPDNAEIGDANGAIENGYDTDNDGLPNFIDEDDDGDNVLTRVENPDPNNDGDLSDAQNTDNDALPDYLDNDDDGDGTLTIDEEIDTQDLNPTNDISNNSIADYLNPLRTESVSTTAYRQHNISVNFNIRAIVQDIRLDFLSQQVLDFGTLSSTNSSENQFSIDQDRTATPVFP